MTKSIGLIFLLAVCLFAADTATAASRVALVIGNSKYQNVSQLPNPIRDASDIAKSLRRIGFAVTEVHDADRLGFADALGRFSEEAAGADIAIFYYAGHGIEVNKDNYLIPVDASLATDRRLRFETITLDDVLGSLEGVAGLRVILVDACRNNPFSASMKLTQSSRSIGRGLAAVEAVSGTVIAYSAKEGTVASDGDGKNSPFAAALLSTLTEPGLEIQFLLRKVRDKVLQDTKGEQEPYISSSLPGDAIYIVPPVVVTAPSGTNANLAPQIAEPESSMESVAVKSDWDAVQNSNSEAALRAFLAKHGDDEMYRALAEEKLSQISDKNSRVAAPKETQKASAAESDAKAKAPAGNKKTKSEQASARKTKTAALTPASPPESTTKTKAVTAGKCPADALQAYKAFKGKLRWSNRLAIVVNHPCGRRIACFDNGGTVACAWRG